MSEKTVALTLLNSMAAPSIEESLDRQGQWGIRHLDLKDRIFGKGVAELSDEEAASLASLVDTRGMTVYCLSTQIFHLDIEDGRAAFDRDLQTASRVLEIARLLRPHFIRLLSARTSRRAEFDNSVDYIADRRPWLFDYYRRAVDVFASASFMVTIENEVGDDIFATPQEISDFFRELDRGEVACFTFDVQNLWQSGTYPSVEVYEALRPLIGYFHLKGGIAAEAPADTPGEGSAAGAAGIAADIGPAGDTGSTSRAGPAGGPPLEYRSSLADASWPVKEITGRVVADRISPVICLNPSHGESKPGYDYEGVVKRDIRYLRETFAEIE